MYELLFLQFKQLLPDFWTTSVFNVIFIFHFTSLHCKKPVGGKIKKNDALHNCNGLLKTVEDCALYLFLSVTSLSEV